MTIDPKLENYLTALDASLGQISISDRADIITEIKSHVLEAQQKDPSKTLNQILFAMGEPEIIAKRYLQERGLQPLKPASQASMMWLPATIKWLVFGFISFVAMIFIALMIMFWKFTPFISVDEEHGRVSIGNGLINVQKTPENIGKPKHLKSELKISPQ